MNFNVDDIWTYIMALLVMVLALGVILKLKGERVVTKEVWWEVDLGDEEKIVKRFYINVLIKDDEYIEKLWNRWEFISEIDRELAICAIISSWLAMPEMEIKELATLFPAWDEAFVGDLINFIDSNKIKFKDSKDYTNMINYFK